MSGIGTVDDDPKGNLVELFGKDLQVKTNYLVLGIRAARVKFKYSPSSLIDEMLVGSPFFREDRREFFEHGLAAYEGGDYMKAIHILVPQVENVMRELLGTVGPKMKRAPKQPEFFEYKNMNDFFREPRIIEALEENLYLFLKSLYIDKRSYNLRNDLVHGLVDAAALTEQTASLVFQSIILLSMPRPDQVFVRAQGNAEECNRDHAERRQPCLKSARGQGFALWFPSSENRHWVIGFGIAESSLFHQLRRARGPRRKEDLHHVPVNREPFGAEAAILLPEKSAEIDRL